MRRHSMHLSLVVLAILAAFASASGGGGGSGAPGIMIPQSGDNGTTLLFGLEYPHGPPTPTFNSTGQMNCPQTSGQVTGWTIGPQDPSCPMEGSDPGPISTDPYVYSYLAVPSGTC